MEHLGYDFTIGACQSHLASLRQPFAETDRVDAFGVEHLIQLVAVSIKSGCWFGTLIVPYIGNHNQKNWLRFFQRAGSTINQK